MARRKTDLGTSSAVQYTAGYTGIKGVDFSSDPSVVASDRAARLTNMYRDYDSEHGAAVETIPGYRRLFDFGGRINGMWGYASSQSDDREEYMVVHSGTKLLAFKLSERDDGLYKEYFDGLADGRSSAFLQNNSIYVCDGRGIYVMSPEGDGFKVTSLCDSAYVPVTYIAGEPYEQRNMLTNAFINRDTAVSEEKYERYVNGHCYDEQEGAGDLLEWIEKYSIKYDVENSYALGGGSYLVKSMTRDRILDEFDARELQSSYLYGDSYMLEGNDLVNAYGYYDLKLTVDLLRSFIAQGGGKKLRRLICRDYIRPELKELADEVYCGSDIPMIGMFMTDVVIYEPCLELKKVTVGGKEIPEYAKAVEGGGERPDIFYMPVGEYVTADGEGEWYISHIHIYSEAKADLNACEVDIYGIAKEVKVKKISAVVSHTDYLNANTEYGGSSVDAILGCSVSASFDGRVFLTGNSRLPNTVFYSCRDMTGYNNPAYYGVYNYFNDGMDNAPNVALLATSSVLMVMKKSALHGSSIYYHTAADGIDDIVPRIYPSVPGVAGIGCLGSALNFLDDAVFISDRGIEGISKETLNLERTIGHRSSNIDRLLRNGGSDVLAGAFMCRWGGYLCVFDGLGHIYLGDSRSLFKGIDGAVEYEWFYLDGIFGYRGAKKRFRTLTYVPTFADGSLLTEAEGASDFEAALAEEYVDYGEVKSAEVFYGGVSHVVYYTEAGGRKFICDCDGEYEGGEQYPACVGYSAHGILYFGTSGGQVCCFNTDKRGEAVGASEVRSDRIHRSWYTFDGHRYRSALELCSDNCGVPHLTKRTVGKTCVLKLKSFPASAPLIKVRTDREAYEDISSSLNGSLFDVGDIDFGTFSFSTSDETIIVIDEKKKRWTEKQFYIGSDDFMRPFGFYNLAYNYEIQGKVKR